MEKKSLISEFIDDDRYLYLYLSENEIIDFISKIEFKNDKEDIIKNYQTKTLQLPNGFKRDYGVGMSDNSFFFHMDYDTSYNKSAITRKLKFLNQKRVDCVFNGNILCHDFHSKDYTKLYKSESSFHIYEGTIFHTKEYWKNGGFRWSDINSEGRFFSDNHGSSRKMDNYYDSVKLLTIKNVRNYNPIALDLNKSEFTYELKQSVIDSITLEMNPIKDKVETLMKNITTINVLGIHSEYIESLYDLPRYNCSNITDKIKQTKIAKEIKKINNKFQILLFGSKQPVWSMFEDIYFDCIILETYKNNEQMDSIIQNCKKYTYLLINGIYINKELLSN